GKLMRGVDLEPIRAALAARSEHAARDGQQFKRVEHWRDRLIAEGAPALEELMQWRAGMDRTDWLRRVAAAQSERERLGTTGSAAHLPGMTASKTSLPVLGVPVQSKTLNGMDSLLSIVQMPAGVPVATFAIGTAGATNAALSAAAILANKHPAIAAALDAFRA